MADRTLRIGIVLAIVGVWLVLPTSAQQSAKIPSPEQFFGFSMGTDRRLAHWDDMVDYYQTVAKQSDRMVVEELGKTTMGEPYLLLIISSPKTIRELPRFQAMQRQLANPRQTTAEAAEMISQTGKAVVLVGANVHSTEIGTSQMMNDIVYQLATEESQEVDHILENTIVLLIPSQNPDGQRMVVDWYNRNLDTPYEGSPLPNLYHKYTGHDNNRDSYMLTQVETQYLNRVLYHDWLPEVYLDAHQMGNAYARIFVPPFKNPPNPNIDPLVWSQVNQFGQAMASKLHAADKVGVIWGELYSGFWQGANNTNPWWHNMVALLTEVASANLASPVQQLRASDRRKVRLAAFAQGDHQLVLAAPTDTQYRMNYPRPWLGGTWTFSDVVEYSLLSTQGLLESVANNRASLKRNFYNMNRRTVERFADGSPFAFLIPPEQHDPSAVMTLLRLLRAEAAEVHVADASFVADRREYPAGTHVVRLDQPFGRWVKDILEPQNYPDIRWPDPTASLDKPYDITAWSLGMLMGVNTVQIETPFEASLTLLVEDAVLAPGRVMGSGTTYLLSHESNQSFIALNRLLALGATVEWAKEPLTTGGTSYPTGVMLVENIDREVIERVAKNLHLDFVATNPASSLDVPMLPIHAPRLAVYEPWGAHIDAGWTRWVLEQHEFQYTQLRGADIQNPDMSDRFDVIILPEASTVDLLHGQQARNVRPEYQGGIGVQGIQNIRRFVSDGGTVITLGNSSTFAIQHLSAPLRNVVQDETQDTFYAPGTLLRVAVNTAHPIGYGMPAEADVMFVNNGGFVRDQRQATSHMTQSVVRYPNAALRRSGWIIGEERLRNTSAVIEVPLDSGRVILHTFRVQHRGQTWGTFKLLFNSIFYGPAASGDATFQPTLDSDVQ
jgi:hypothetical protein